MDACKLDADANQKLLKKWLISPEVGYDLGELPDEGFLLLSYDDLQKAGLPWEEWQSCQVRMALQVLAGEPAASNGTPPSIAQLKHICHPEHGGCVPRAARQHKTASLHLSETSMLQQKQGCMAKPVALLLVETPYAAYVTCG